MSPAAAGGPSGEGAAPSGEAGAAPSLGDEAEERYREALERRGMADARPLLRTILRDLRTRDPGAYEEAVSRYEEELLPSVAGGEEDPFDAWMRYGTWLAGRLVEGRAVAVDTSGRAAEVGRRVPTPSLVLFLPDGQGRPALTLAVPAEPSEHQEAARELLCG